MELISVLIPTFNAEPYVAATIESVLAQTDRCFEIVVVDDGSSDRTCEILRQYGSRLRLIEQTNKGPAAARNRLLREARGHFVAFLDADDLWIPSKLETQRRLFERYPHLVLVAGRLRDVDATGRPTEMKEPGWSAQLRDKPLSLHRELLHRGNMIAQSSVMAIRSEVLQSGGWYADERILSTDYELWIRLAERGQFFVSSGIVGDYRVLERSLSHGCVSREYEGQRRILEMHRQHFTDRNYRRRLSRLYFDWAESAFVQGDSSAWSVVRNALRLNPLNTAALWLAAKQSMVEPFRQRRLNI